MLSEEDARVSVVFPFNEAAGADPADAGRM